MIEIDLKKAWTLARRAEACREWRRKNPDKVRKGKAQYRRNNRADERARDREWRRKNPRQFPTPMDIPEYAQHTAAHREVYNKAKARPKVSFKVDRFASDESVLTFLALVEWHADLFIGKNSALADTLCTMVLDFGIVGDAVPLPAFAKALGITQSAAYGRKMHLRKYISAIHGYAHAAGILDRREHTAYE